MLVCLDVDYRATVGGERAIAAAVVVTDARNDVVAHDITVAVDGIAAYVPGAFFERELPCLLAVLDAVVDVVGTARFTIVVDAHVWLGTHAGLGQRLYDAWTSRHVDNGSADVVVIGVGKTAWHDTSAHRAVVRGGAKALWVSSAGIDVDVAAALIESMHGPYRLPTLLKRVDRLCRDTPLPEAAMTTTILTTPRLRLRRFVDDDVDAQHLVDLNANPNVTRFVGEGPVDLDTARSVIRDRLIAQHDRYGVGRWAVEHDGAFIGWCGFKYVVDDDPARNHYDVGYRFFEKDWGKGFASEAATACMQWADTHLVDAEIVGRARVENAASIAILKKLGGIEIATENDLDGVVTVLRLRARGSRGAPG